MSSAALKLVPSSAPFETPTNDLDALLYITPFNPTVLHVTQEAALDVVSELEQKKFAEMGSVEQYSGIHPKHGPCIILITSSSDSIIIPIL
ncbi:hypothetical protein FV222_01530 [Methylobacterium sp. WL103]|uniref:hypothetical protein n=1 Tax=Methylobacterium sp. WL103 TaxID=2603891 RepID=UPI0011CBEA9A|nr:hypothetical protein [Methylobacterium sp. WL103]TXN07944.1 hypothetical protein FV222_01530 [Methylobacterium sp. WL103]